MVLFLLQGSRALDQAFAISLERVLPRLEGDRSLQSGEQHNAAPDRRAGFLRMHEMRHAKAIPSLT